MHPVTRRYVVNQGWEERPDHPTVAQADQLKAQLADRLAALAAKRLHAWHREFRRKFPRLHGRLIFGMGVVSLSIGAVRSDKVVCESDCDRYRSLQTLKHALDDVSDICGNYTLACPEDFEW